METILAMIQKAYPGVTQDKLGEQICDFSRQETWDTFMDVLKYVYTTTMPFNRHLGIRVDKLTRDLVIVRFAMRPEFIGNYEQGVLHGGVISAVIDLTGGLISQVNALVNLDGRPLTELYHDLARMSTINIRVDYLKPGSGKEFRCEGRIKRVGSRVGVTSLEVFNDLEELVAVGTGSYMVG